MSLPDPQCRVRLTDDAVADLLRLQKKDPQIVRAMFKKMLLLERSPNAGEPLLGALIGFRKLIVGNRDYRIVWRQRTDEGHMPVLEIAEVWAAGARADDEVYKELTSRLEELGKRRSPEVRALADVIADMGRFYSGIHAHAEPVASPSRVNPELPPWLTMALEQELHLTEEQISALEREEAQRLMTEHWSKPND